MKKNNLLKMAATRLKQVIYAVKEFPLNVHEFGFCTAMLIVRRRFGFIKAEKYIERMSSCTKKEIDSVIEKYKKQCFSKASPKADFKDKYPVWVCWLQGEDKMPEFCRACVNNIKGMLPDNAQLVFITYNNLGEYLNIPEHVLKKHYEGKISPVHFSDVVRFGLLANYGGAWIDTAIYLTQNVIEKAFKYQIYTPRFYLADSTLLDASRGKWVGGCWFSQKGNILFSFVYDALIHFWKNHNKALEYLFFDYVIWNGYVHIDEIKTLLDSVPENNFSLRLLNDHLNDEYTPELFEQIANENEIHLVNRHKEYLKETPSGKITIYGYLIKKYYFEAGK